MYPIPNTLALSGSVKIDKGPLGAFKPPSTSLEDRKEGREKGEGVRKELSRASSQASAMKHYPNRRVFNIIITSTCILDAYPTPPAHGIVPPLRRRELSLDVSTSYPPNIQERVNRVSIECQHAVFIVREGIYIFMPLGKRALNERVLAY